MAPANQARSDLHTMAQKLEEINKRLQQASLAGSGDVAPPPEWLPKLLDSVPGLPLEALPHHKPNHADLQGAIADASFHPALEACLHLINVSILACEIKEIWSIR